MSCAGTVALVGMGGEGGKGRALPMHDREDSADENGFCSGGCVEC